MVLGCLIHHTLFSVVIHPTLASHLTQQHLDPQPLPFIAGFDSFWSRLPSATPFSCRSSSAVAHIAAAVALSHTSCGDIHPSWTSQQQQYNMVGDWPTHIIIHAYLRLSLVSFARPGSPLQACFLLHSSSRPHPSVKHHLPYYSNSTIFFFNKYLILTSLVGTACLFL